MKVLVVEDEIGAREALVELVRDLGHDVSAAATVADARSALGLAAPDVCITDLGLPDGDGLDVVRAAKSAVRDCTVLVLTGKGMRMQEKGGLPEGTQVFPDLAAVAASLL